MPTSRRRDGVTIDQKCINIGSCIDFQSSTDETCPTKNSIDVSYPPGKRRQLGQKPRPKYQSNRSNGWEKYI